MTNANEPAYPVDVREWDNSEQKFHYSHSLNGLTKREAFAMAAMQGIVTAAPYAVRTVAAQHAIEFADALLAELEKTA